MTLEACLNVGLFAEGLLLLAVVYRLSGAADGEIMQVAPPRRASLLRLRRVHWTAMTLAILTLVAVLVHLLLRNVFLLGPTPSIAALIWAALMAVALVWATIEIRLDRGGERVSP